MGVRAYFSYKDSRLPGTWWFAQDSKTTWALVACPACGDPMPVGKPGCNHSVDWQALLHRHEALVHPSMICSCGFHDFVRLDWEESPEVPECL